MRNNKLLRNAGSVGPWALLTILSAALFFSCLSPVNSPVSVKAKATAGKGTVYLSIAGSGARTVLPDNMGSLTYAVACVSGTDTVNASLDNGTGTVNLTADEQWTITITASLAGSPVGSALVTVTPVESQVTNVNDIFIQPLTGGAKGVLAWQLTFPAGLTSAELYYNDGSDQSVDLLTKNSGEIQFVPGSYLFRSVLKSADGKQAGATEVVHIYPGMNTTLAWTFTGDSFSTAMDVPVSVQLDASSGVIVNAVSLNNGADGFTGVKAGNTWNFVLPAVPLSQDSIGGLYLDIVTSNNSLSTEAASYAVSADGTISLPPVSIYKMTLAKTGTGDLTLAVSGNSTVKQDALQADLLGGESISVTAAAASGYGFSKFTSSGVVLASDTANPAVFVMPFADAAITAAFVPQASGSYSVWFNTGSGVYSDTAGMTIPAQIVTNGKASDPLTGGKTLTKDGFTFKGWYTKRTIDPDTGLWVYDSADKWDFAANTVSGDMTLYAGWDGGEKYNLYASDWAGQIAGYYVWLDASKTYIIGTRYYINNSAGNGGGTPPILMVMTGDNDGCPNNGHPYSYISLALTKTDYFSIDEFTFTAPESRWYFVGIENHLARQLHFDEIWLREKGTGDVNLLPYGDFIFADSTDMWNNIAVEDADSYYTSPFNWGSVGTGVPRWENGTKWILCKSDYWYIYSWVNGGDSSHSWITLPDPGPDKFPEPAANPTTIWPITVNQAAGGTISGANDWALEGDTVTVTATPDTGYKFDYFVINGQNKTDNPASFSVPANGATVSAVFEGVNNTVTVVQSPEGVYQVEVDGSAATQSNTSVQYGKLVTLRVVSVSDGYYLDKFTIDENVDTGLKAVTANSVWQFTMPSQDVTVRAVFTELSTDEYGITVNKTGNTDGGTVTIVGGIESAKVLDSVTIDVAATTVMDYIKVIGDYTSTDYTSAHLTNNGDGTYTLSMVAEPVTIEVRFFYDDAEGNFVGDWFEGSWKSALGQRVTLGAGDYTIGIRYKVVYGDWDGYYAPAPFADFYQSNSDGGWWNDTGPGTTINMPNDQPDVWLESTATFNAEDGTYYLGLMDTVGSGYVLVDSVWLYASNDPSKSNLFVNGDFSQGYTNFQNYRDWGGDTDNIFAIPANMANEGIWYLHSWWDLNNQN